MQAPPRVLTIAGSDSGGGAGIQADLKTFAAHGVYGMSVITAVTAQNTLEVRCVEEISPAVVGDQIDVLFEDIGVDAVKIGMLSSVRLVEKVAERLAAYPPRPIVLDPVMISKSGAALLADDAIEALREKLLPLATLTTPNLPEAERLSGLSDSSLDARPRLAAALRVGSGAVLLKGGHGEEDPVVDLLFDGQRFHRFSWPRLRTRSTHGTGCTLSSAIAANLALGLELAEAVERAGSYLHEAMRRAYPLGRGHGPVDHLWRQRG